MEINKHAHWGYLEAEGSWGPFSAFTQFFFFLHFNINKKFLNFNVFFF